MNASKRSAKRKTIVYLAIGFVPIALAVALTLTLGTGTPRVPSANATASQVPGQAQPRPLQLIQGRDLLNGVRTGYPHTLQGAVSAAAGYLAALGSTLDPARASAVMQMVADPSFTDAAQQAQAGAEADRTELGLAVAGDTPQDASLILQPVEYQVRDVTAGRVTVLLLADMAGTMPEQGTVSRTGVFPLQMHWAAGDWKMLPFASTDYSSLSAEPFSADAAAKGWSYLEPAGE